MTYPSNVEQWPIEQATAAWDRNMGDPEGVNLYRNSGPYLDRLKDQIAQEGMKKPLSIGTRGDGSPIIEDGHHRLWAARQLGMTHVPVVRHPDNLLYRESKFSNDYRMQHRPPDAEHGAPFHDAAAEYDDDSTERSAYPPDVYEHPEWYGHEEGWRESFRAMQQARGNPEHPVTIYRAAPTADFNTGDWVTPSLQYAQQHSRHFEDPALDMPVHSITVPAKHLHTDADSLNEWGYNGPSTVGQRTASRDEPTSPADEWHQVSEKEKRHLIGNEQPDSQLKNAELVPIEALDQMHEFDRRPGTPDAHYTPERWAALKAHIAQHGITSPVWIDYNPDNNECHLAEGNHRLGVAKELGMTHLPAVVYKSTRKSRGNSVFAPTAYIPEPHMYRDHFEQTPQYLKPSELGFESQPWGKAEPFKKIATEWQPENPTWKYPRGRVSQMNRSELARHNNHYYSNDEQFHEGQLKNERDVDRFFDYENPMDYLRSHLNQLADEHGINRWTVEPHRLPNWGLAHTDTHSITTGPLTSRADYLLGLHELGHLVGGREEMHDKLGKKVLGPGQTPGEVPNHQHRMLDYTQNYRPIEHEYDRGWGGYPSLAEDPNSMQHSQQWVHAPMEPLDNDYDPNEPDSIFGDMDDDNMTNTSPFTFSENKLETEARAWEWALQHSKVHVSAPVLHEIMSALMSYASPSEISHFSPTAKRIFAEHYGFGGEEGRYPLDEKTYGPGAEGATDPWTEWKADKAPEGYGGLVSPGGFMPSNQIEKDNYYNQVDEQRRQKIQQRMQNEALIRTLETPLRQNAPDGYVALEHPQSQTVYHFPTNHPVVKYVNDPTVRNMTNANETNMRQFEQKVARYKWSDYQDGKVMYHVAPARLRNQIMSEGLNPSAPQTQPSGHTPGVYLWDSPETAHRYKHQLHNPDTDVWRVNVGDSPMHKDFFLDDSLGDSTRGQERYPGAHYVTHPIAPEQVQMHAINPWDDTFLQSEQGQRLMDIEEQRDLAEYERQQRAAKVAGADHAGAMVAIYPPSDVAEKIAVENGEPAADLHITLIYFQDAAADREGESWDDVAEIVNRVASMTPPVDVKIGGTARFDTPEGDQPVVGTVDAPGLVELHLDLKQALAAAGFDANEDHGFLPHMTFSYVGADEDNPEIDTDTEFTASSITLVVGGEKSEFKLGTSAPIEMPAKAAQTRSNAIAALRRVVGRGASTMDAIPDYTDSINRVQSVLTPDLLHKKYKDSPQAHCYAASEALYHMLGGAGAGLKPMHIPHEGSSHWFLSGPNGEIIDATHGQFENPVPYENARGKGFLTAQPSKRAAEIMRRVAEQHASAWKVSDFREEDHPREEHGKFTVKHDQHEVKVHDKKGKHQGTIKRCKHCGVLYQKPADHRGRMECPTCGLDPERVLRHAAAKPSLMQDNLAQAMGWQFAGYQPSSNHRQYEWTDENGNEHRVTGAGNHGGGGSVPEYDVNHLRQRMTKCMNGKCMHPTVNIGAPTADVPGAPVLYQGQQVTFGGQHYWIMDIDGDLAHIYDEKGAEDIVPTTQLRAAHFWTSAEEDEELAERVRDFNLGDHPDSDPDYAFVYYQGKLEMQHWHHNISYSEMADDLLKPMGTDVLKYDGKLENDTTSDWVAGDVWNGKEVKFSIPQLAKPEVVEDAKAAVKKVLRGTTSGWIASA